MIRVLFVCHGNICRSPMAEFVMKDLVDKRGMADRFEIASAAARDDDVGCDMHPGTKRVLSENGIPFEKRRARQLCASDATGWDVIVGMDRENMRDIPRMLGISVGRASDGCPAIPGDRATAYKLLDFTGSDSDVYDPWYTGDFETTFQDVKAGCEAVLDWLAV